MAINVNVEPIDPDKPHYIPTKGSEEAAGYDLRVVKSAMIAPGGVALLETNLKFGIPRGWELQIRQRSGMSIAFPGYLANSVGTIDSDYTGELKIMFTNTTENTVCIDFGQKVAQMLLKPVWDIEFKSSPVIDKDRGAGGFGSTGK